MKGLTTAEFHALVARETDEETGFALMRAGRIVQIGSCTGGSEPGVIFYALTDAGRLAARIYARWIGAIE